MDNLSYLFAAYIVIWLGIFGYMLTLDSRQRSLRREIEALKLSFSRDRRPEPARPQVDR